MTVAYRLLRTQESWLARYTQEQLKGMAEIVMQDDAAGGIRTFQLLIMMSQITGIHPNEVRARIRRLAEG